MAVKNQLFIRANLRLVVSIAKNAAWGRRTNSLSWSGDGNMSSIHAVEKSDSRRARFKFNASTYASWAIIKNYVPAPLPRIGDGGTGSSRATTSFSRPPPTTVQTNTSMRPIGAPHPGGRAARCSAGSTTVSGRSSSSRFGAPGGGQRS